MKDENGKSPEVFFRMIQNYKETQVLLTALRLNAFSYLDTPITAKDFSKATGYDERNCEYFLNALVSIDLVIKEDYKYYNTESVNIYLNDKSEFYMGKYMLFREKMTTLDGIDDFIIKGPNEAVKKRNCGNEVYDFKELAETSEVEMKTRIPEFLSFMERVLDNRKVNKVLDLGGGCGFLTIELVKKYPRIRGVIFEHPDVTEVARKNVIKNSLEEKIEVIPGDFMVDDIGGDYDIVICSGVLLFGGKKLNCLVGKVFNSLNKNGILMNVPHKCNEDCTKPEEMVIGWLGSHLKGMDVLISYTKLEKALTDSGFVKNCEYSDFEFKGYEYDIYTKF